MVQPASDRNWGQGQPKVPTLQRSPDIPPNTPPAPTSPLLMLLGRVIRHRWALDRLGKSTLLVAVGVVLSGEYPLTVDVYSPEYLPGSQG